MPRAPASERRTRLLDAAFATFIRYGYRKTSMDDVAREAEISRPALYLHFADKEALFRECMKHSLDAAMADVRRALAAPDSPLHERLVRAIDEWAGRHIGKPGSDASDLGEAGRALLGTLFDDYSAELERMLARAIADSPLAPALKRAKHTPQQVAATLYACARGWKHHVASRAELVKRMEVAVRLLLPGEK